MTARTNPWTRRGLALIVVGFLVFLIGPVLVVLLGPPPYAIIPPLIGFALMVGGGFAMAVSDESETARRPGTRGPDIVKLACPNCGAAVESIDAIGTVTCEYCGTSFLVR